MDLWTVALLSSSHSPFWFNMVNVPWKFYHLVIYYKLFNIKINSLESGISSFLALHILVIYV